MPAENRSRGVICSTYFNANSSLHWSGGYFTKILNESVFLLLTTLPLTGGFCTRSCVTNDVMAATFGRDVTTSRLLLSFLPVTGMLQCVIHRSAMTSIRAHLHMLATVFGFGHLWWQPDLLLALNVFIVFSRALLSVKLRSQSSFIRPDGIHSPPTPRRGLIVRTCHSIFPGTLTL